LGGRRKGLLSPITDFKRRYFLKRTKIRMIAEMGDIDPGRQGGFQNGLSFIRLDFFSIYDEFNIHFAHNME
jgi:hypothetical protein